MRQRLISIVSLCCAVICAAAQVRPGIEVLRDNGFDILKGKRVGLITNPTGVDNNLVSTIDILADAPEVNLVALFAPEHGVRGDIVAGQTVTAGTDARTGLPVRSLYGKTKKPTAEMLADIDVLVYDIQDNGSRSYTFISTMGNAMTACGEHGKDFVVLDRPNPLGGNKVEGRVRDSDCSSFVSRYAIPYIYGLTCGELATYLNETGQTGAKARLTVVPMEGWNRDMLFEDTGMPWVQPSPQIPSAETAIYYPATGILGELSYASIGVGYTLPFMTVAAPWIKAPELTDALNALDLKGVMFRPIYYKPRYGIHADKQVQGVQIYVTEPDEAELTLIQFYVMQELARLYQANKPFASDPSRFAMFDKVVGTKLLRPAFGKRYRVDDIVDLWHEGVEDWKRSATKYHLYR